VFFACGLLSGLAGCTGGIRYPSYYLLNVPQSLSPKDPSKPILGSAAVREFSAPRFLKEGSIVYRPAPEQLGRFAAGQGRAPPFHYSFDVLGMDVRCPLPTLQILKRPPYVPQPCLIEEIEVPVRRTRVNQAGGRPWLALYSLRCSPIPRLWVSIISGRFATGELAGLQMRSQLFLSVENAPLDRSDGDLFRSRDLVIFPLLDKTQGQSLALA